MKLCEVECTAFETCIRFDTQHPRTNQESNCNQKNQGLKKKNSEMEDEALDFLIASRIGLDAQVRCAFGLLAFDPPRRRELNSSVVKSRTRATGGLHTDEAAVYGISLGVR